ncbi:MAG: hypothetical protein ABSH11_11785 [Verrucomicrobiota bacterium]|jgi:hypothetical protein
MTTTTAHKRLDELEMFLTPKEWAIRLVDEARKYPSAFDHLKALAKLPINELPMQRPYYAFEEQAGELHPGQKLEDIRARHRMTDALWNEFYTLKLLICRVNQAMERKAESIGLQAALQLSALHALILEDVLAHTATHDAALTEAGNDETSLKEWSHEFTVLLKDLYAHRAAVELIQGEHFDGHPILFLNWEAELTAAGRTIESAVTTANKYLKCRTERDGAGTNGSAGESDLAIGLESIKASASGQLAADIAEKWLHDVRLEAVESDAEQWEQWREGSGTPKPATGNG